jgi:hypothetical protein
MSKECILPVVSFPSRASESNDCVERSILKKIEQAYFAKLATKAKSDSTLRHSAVFRPRL